MIPTNTQLAVDATKTLRYTGYKNRDMHIKSGDTVRVPKGTELRSTHPQKHGVYEAGKTYKVKVTHTNGGRTITVGHIWPNREGPVYTGQRERDLLNYCEMVGISYTWRLGNHEAAIQELYSRAYEVDDGYGHGGKDLKVDLSNPTVHWAGSGGYWVWADINDVVKVTSC